MDSSLAPLVVNISVFGISFFCFSAPCSRLSWLSPVITSIMFAVKTSKLKLLTGNGCRPKCSDALRLESKSIRCGCFYLWRVAGNIFYTCLMRTGVQFSSAVNPPLLRCFTYSSWRRWSTLAEVGTTSRSGLRASSPFSTVLCRPTGWHRVSCWKLSFSSLNF